MKIKIIRETLEQYGSLRPYCGAKRIRTSTLDIFTSSRGLFGARRWANESGTSHWKAAMAIVAYVRELKEELANGGRAEIKNLLRGSTSTFSLSWYSILPLLKSGKSLKWIKRRIEMMLRYPVPAMRGYTYHYGEDLSCRSLDSVEIRKFHRDMQLPRWACVSNADIRRLNKIREVFPWFNLFFGRGRWLTSVLVGELYDKLRVDWTRMQDLLRFIKDEPMYAARCLAADITVAKRYGSVHHLEEGWLRNLEPEVTKGIKSFVWKMKLGRVPQDPNMLELELEHIEALAQPGVMKVFLRLKKYIELFGSVRGHDLIGLVNAVVTFGQNAERFVATLESLNDASSMPLRAIEAFAQEWYFNHPGESVAERLIVISRSYDQEIAKAMRSKLSFREVWMVVSSQKYVGVTNRELAYELGKWGYSQDDFENAQEHWNVFCVMRESMPAVTVEHGEYRMSRLDRSDPRQLTIGNYTNCCQKLGGAGESCCWYSISSPGSSTWIVEKAGRIIAQSWAWRNGDAVVFDNVEALSPEYVDVIAELYREVAQKLLGNLGIARVHVGAGYDDLGVDRYFSRVDDLDAIDLPDEAYGVYTDSSVQYLIAGVKA